MEPFTLAISVVRVGLRSGSSDRAPPLTAPNQPWPPRLYRLFGLFHPICDSGGMRESVDYVFGGRPFHPRRECV